MRALVKPSREQADSTIPASSKAPSTSSATAMRSPSRSGKLPWQTIEAEVQR
jgi:hypothetical protein